MPNETIAFDQVRDSADAAAIKKRPAGQAQQIAPASAYDQLTDPEDAAGIKSPGQ